MSDVSDQWWSGYASAVAAPKHEFALAERFQRWSATISAALAGTRSATAEVGQCAPPEPEDWSLEFALDAAVVGGQRESVTKARPSKVAVKGRKKVDRQLAWLGEGWHVLHVVDE